MILKALCMSLIAVVVVVLSFDSYAASCNPKAEVHQIKARDIQMHMGLHNIPSREDEEFVVCMLAEKEDKAAFRARVQRLKDQQRAAQAREAVRQRQAEIERTRPPNAEEMAFRKFWCEDGAKYAQNAQAYIDYCYAQYTRYPRSKCGMDYLPCGEKCMNRFREACVNGVVQAR